MPGMYSAGDYDLAGFCLGAVERGSILTGDKVTSGDIVIGLASDGLHSNGYSLARKTVESAGLTFQSIAPFNRSTTLGKAMMVPTRMYVKSCLAAIQSGGIHALAHITGGGLTENIPRVLPDGLGVELDAAKWIVPDIFKWIAKTGGVASDEMNRTFNCGVGMVCIITSNHVDKLRKIFETNGERVFTIGKVVSIDGNTPSVKIANPETQWE